MKNIKLIVRENLIKKFQINESLNEITLEENEDLKFAKTMNHLGRLIDEGYDETQLNSHIDEQFDWLRNILPGSNSKSPVDNANANKVGTGLFSAGFNQLKQWAIRQALGYLGLNPEGKIAYGVSTAMSEMSIMDLVSVFRSKDGCMAHSQDVARGIIDGLVAYIRTDDENAKEYKPNSMFGNFIQNALSQYLYQQGMYKAIGNFVCKAIYDNKNKKFAPLPAQQQAPQNTEQNSSEEPEQTGL
jgi:hypothetical protein